MATFFYSGLSPKAPGTIGTIAAIPLVYMMTFLSPMIYMGCTLVFVVFSIFISHRYDQALGKHDSSEIVIDEVAGFMVTMIWLPPTWHSFVIGFVLFRALDILKPFPIRTLDQRIQGGLGVVADDIAAGIVANILLQVLYTHTDVLGVQLPPF